MTRAREGELPPRCQDCDGRLKPDTVLFGERLPEHARLRADKLAQDADVFLAVGSSLTVEPAASLPLTAARHGAAVAVVNMDDTQHDDRADHVFHADVTEVLPALVEAVERRDVGGADG
jgi:NAD-dependent deacetylase